VNLIPTDVNNTIDTWPQGLGELSQIGMAQELKLGQALNERYGGILVSLNYSQPEIYVRSDDYNRTLMSAMANLAGFYQNSTTEVNVDGWPSPHWQPIPIHTVALGTDNIINMGADCPKVKEIMAEKVLTQADYRTNASYYEPLFSYLTEKCEFGYKITLLNIDDVFDPINAELSNPEGHSWPNYINESIYEQIRDAHKISWDYSYCDPTIARLRGGPILGDITRRMQQKRTSLANINDTSLNWVRKLKYYMYSGHDATINAFLSTLGAEYYTGGQPGYSACVLLELWANETDSFVRTYYRQNDSVEFFPIQIAGCPSLPNDCTLDTFYSRSIDFIPTNWAEECQVDVKKPSLSTAVYPFQALILIFVTLLLARQRTTLELL